MAANATRTGANGVGDKRMMIAVTKARIPSTPSPGKSPGTARRPDDGRPPASEIVQFGELLVSGTGSKCKQNPISRSQAPPGNALPGRHRLPGVRRGDKGETDPAR